SPEVIRALAAIAAARGWRRVILVGSDTFKQRMRVAARLAGLDARALARLAHGRSRDARGRRLTSTRPLGHGEKTPVTSPTHRRDKETTPPARGERKTVIERAITPRGDDSPR